MTLLRRYYLGSRARSSITLATRSRSSGIAEIVRESYPDPTAGAGEPWVVVDVRAVEPLPKPVTLAAVKAEPRLKDMALAKYARLSVQPVTDAEWKLVCKMGGVKG
jgi:predicted RNA-binding protein with PUA-like domain